MKYEMTEEQFKQILAVMSETPYKYSALPVQILSQLKKIEEPKIEEPKKEE